MVNFAEHEHDYDPWTYRCRICGDWELVTEAQWLRAFAEAAIKDGKDPREMEQWLIS